MSNLPLTLLKLSLAALVVFLGYRFYADLRGPIVFTKESALRDEAVVVKLEKIKQAQDAYYRVTGRYTDSFDSLLIVCLRDSFTMQNEQLILRDKYDPAVHGKNPQVYGDTTKYRIVNTYQVAIRDSLFSRLKYPVEDISLIPFGEGKRFHMAASVVEAAGGRYKVPTYEVTAPKKYYYKGLNKDYFDPMAGYQLGSVTDANTDIYPSPSVYYPD